jgi:hypothetical protein
LDISNCAVIMMCTGSFLAWERRDGIGSSEETRLHIPRTKALSRPTDLHCESADMKDNVRAHPFQMMMMMVELALQGC